MKRYFQTLKFFWSLFHPSQVGTMIRSITLDTHRQKNMPVDIYTRSQKSQKSKGIVLIVHGMNKYGKDDPRIVDLAKAIAALNFKVIVPSYDFISNLLIDNAVVNDITQSIEVLLDMPGLICAERLAVFSASYSGGMALRACAQPSVAAHISAFCTIGSPSNFLTSYAFALGKNGSTDKYARLIFLRALLYHSGDYSEVFDQGLLCAIDDAFVKIPQDRFEEYLKTIDIEEQQKLKNVVENIFDTEVYLKKYEKFIKIFDQAYETAADFRRLQCKVALVHSATDTIFEPRETTHLFEQLQKSGVECQMLITPLLDHVNHHFNLTQLHELWRLIGVFSYFFRYI